MSLEKRWHEVEKEVSVHSDVQPPLSQAKPVERWLRPSQWTGSHLFHFVPPLSRLKPWRGGAKREKRWLAFIEVRVSHLFFRHEVGKRWLTATTMDDSHLFFHSAHHSGKARSGGGCSSKWTDSHLFFHSHLSHFV
jgi:hypothetical protein